MRSVVLSVAAGALVLCAPQSWAQTYVAIDLAPEINFARNDSIMLNGASYPVGAQTLACVPFEMEGDANPATLWGWTAYRAPGGTTSDPVSEVFDIGLSGATRVYTLMNSFWGQPGPAAYCTLRFDATGGLTHTVDFVGNDDIRDYNQNPMWTNSINGVTTIQVFSTGVGQRLDMQIIDLPAAFAGETLTTMTVTDTGRPDFQRVFLAGLTVQQGACRPDLTGDSCVNTNDFFAFLALYQATDPRADFSPGGGINTNDFFAFLAAYQQGC